LIVVGLVKVPVVGLVVGPLAVDVDFDVVSGGTTIDVDVNVGTTILGWPTVLFARELDLRVVAITLLVDSNVVSSELLVAARTAVSDGDVDFFLGEPSIFPSDARGGLR